MFPLLSSNYQANIYVCNAVNIAKCFVSVAASRVESADFANIFLSKFCGSVFLTWTWVIGGFSAEEFVGVRSIFGWRH